MKIEKLNENKIKVTISYDDLAKRNIDVHSFIYNSPESQDLFWDVMCEAERQYGFVVGESMVYVEASASSPGFFTLIVTKSAEKNSLSPSKHNLKKNNIRLKRKAVSSKFNNSIFMFESFNDVCDFCSVIDVSKVPTSSLYRMDGQYFLSADIMPYSIILEYASLVKFSDMFLAKIKEYGSIIIENDALLVISKFFVKKSKKKAKRI